MTEFEFAFHMWAEPISLISDQLSFHDRFHLGVTFEWTSEDVKGIAVDANVGLPVSVDPTKRLWCENNKTLFTSEYQYLIMNVAFQLNFY